MAHALRKMAPLLVMAGVALMPKERATTARRVPARPQTPTDEAKPDRSTTNPAEMTEPGRGRHADAPNKIPPRGWKDILIRAVKEFGDDQIPLISAGVTFYALLALFPGLGALVALYGLFADVAEARHDLAVLSFILPPDVLRLIGEQMVRISAAHAGGLSLALVGGLVLSIWSANGAMKAVIQALNIAYEEQEKRKFVRKTAISLVFTVGFLLFAVATIAVLAAPAAIKPFAGETVATMVGWISWPLLVAGLGLGLALLYRYAPSRDDVKWRWISWGSVAVLVAWTALSAAFSLYAANFAHYDKTYGSLGAVIGLMMWIYFSSQVVLFGAELNSEIEHQTLKDTTVGPPKPLGQRGAVMADTVGAAQG
jgi:membrane protein